ncbi:MAG: hypothetical protein RR425_04870 [Erysipelotrichales bacterium]
MNNKYPDIYKNYPIKPYIDNNRDINDWLNNSDKYPYGIVEKKKMELNEDNLLAGDIILLWRINFDNFTNKTIIPQYFEYRYGIDTSKELKLLEERKLIYIEDATNSLDLLTIKELNNILTKNNLKVKGNKAKLLEFIKKEVDEISLCKDFKLRRYRIASQGKKILDKYPEIIKKHGPKKNAK